MGCLCFRRRSGKEGKKNKGKSNESNHPEKRHSIMSTYTPAPASTLRYDPEYWKAIEPFADQKVPKFKTVFDLRTHTDNLLGGLFRLEPSPGSIEQTKFEVTSSDGHKLALTRFATASQTTSKEPLPAVLYLHGGGLISCSVDTFGPFISRTVHTSGVQYFAVEYRLAPEHPAPAALEDAYAALQYLSTHASEHCVDRTRIMLVGDSAGGGLAAGVALMARDRGFAPAVSKMVLFYPMLDDRTTVAYGGEWPVRPFLTWRDTDNALAWDAYLGAGKRGGDDVSAYAAPARAGSLNGLPETYIDVGGLDLFRDECFAFAARLAAENIQVEFHLWPGVPHGFEGTVGPTVSRVANETRIRAIKAI